MINQEIHVGTQNKLIPYDLKVGLACTFIVAEGTAKVLKPVIPVVGTSLSKKLDLEYQRKLRYMSNRRDRIRGKA